MSDLVFQNVLGKFSQEEDKLLETATIKGILLTEIIDKYKELQSMKDTCKYYSISAMTLRKYFNKYNIPIIGRGYASQRVIYNPFKDASKEDKGYWVGFIAGDGYLEEGKDGNKNGIVIVSKDKDIIDAFVEFTNNSANVYTRKIPTGLVYTARFFNKDAKEYLKRMGIVSNKSLILQFKVKLDWNIFRGLFDADGSLSGGRLKITTGSPYVVVQLESFLNKEGIKTSVAKKGTAFDVYLLSNGTARADSLKLLRSKIYPENVKYFMNRKKKQMDALCSDT